MLPSRALVRDGRAGLLGAFDRGATDPAQPGVRRAESGHPLLRPLGHVALAALALALSAPPAAGDDRPLGRIEGIVEDLSGRPVAQAVARLLTAGSSDEPARVSGPDGRFVFEAVAPGRCRVSVTKAPASSSVEEAIEVGEGQTVNVRIRLEFVGIRDSVEVLAEHDPLDPMRVFPGSTLTEDDAEAVPSLGRSALELAALTPGVEVEGGAEGGLNGRAAVTVRAFGSRPSQARYLVDGIDQTLIWRSGARAILPPELVSQVVVSSVAAPAESTSGPGPAVNVVTRSGSNKLHGQAFVFAGDEHLNANSWARNRTQADPGASASQRAASQRPADNRRWLGATLGGPLGKDTFYFVGAETFRDSQAFYYDQTRAPTDAMVRGDFSAIPGLVLIDPDTKRAFTGKIIPSARLDPVAIRLAALVPRVARYGDRYVWSGSEEVQTNEAFAKIDHRIGRRQQITASYAGTWASREQADIAGNRNPSWAGYVDDPSQHMASLRHRWMSGRRVLESTVAFHRLFSDRDNVGSKQQRLDQFGSKWPFAGGDVDYPAPDYLPQLTIAGGMGGAQGALDPIQQQAVTAASALALTRGRHHLKTGIQMAHEEAEVSNRNDLSRLSFDGRYTSSTSGGVAAAGENQYAYGFADFLLGRAVSMGVNARLKNGLSDWSWAVFAQDDWRLSRRLSLSLGLRWELHTSPRQPSGRLSTFDLAHRSDLYPNLPLNMAVDGDRGIPPGLYEPSRFDIAPRLAVSYDLTGDTKTILRSGAGLYYADPPLSQQMFLTENEPFLRSLTGSASRSLVDPWVSTYPQGAPLPLELSPAAVTYKAGQRINLNAVEVDGVDTPYALKMHAVIERQLFRGAALNLGYVGSRGFHYVLMLDRNAPPQTSVGSSSVDTAVDARRPLAAPYRQVRLISPVERPRYDALYATANLRRGRVTGQLNYVLQRSITAAGILPGGDSVANPTVIGTTGQDLDYFAGEADPRHVLRSYLAFSSPLSRKKGWKRLLGGWTVSTLVSYRSGTPLTARAGRDLNFDGISGAGSDRPNQNGAILYQDTTDSRGYRVWFDRQGFSAVAAPSAAAPYPLGNARVGAILGPSWWRIDANLSRQIPITKTVRSVFLLQANNVFNHAPLDNPVTDMSSADFGLITSRGAGPRTLRVGLRVQF
jgi:hypothetical protein